MSKIKEIINKATNTEKGFFIGGILCFIVAGILVIGMTLGDTNSEVLRNQTVDNLLFKEANIKYSEGITTFKVKVLNEGQDLDLRYIGINFENESGNIDTLIGYIGNSIKNNEEKEIVARIDKDLTQSLNISYTIVK